MLCNVEVRAQEELTSTLTSQLRGSKPHKREATTSRSIKLGEDNYLPLRLYQGLKRTLFVKELVNCQVIIKNYLYHHLGEIYSAEETEKLPI